MKLKEEIYNWLNKFLLSLNLNQKFIKSYIMNYLDDKISYNYIKNIYKIKKKRIIFENNLIKSFDNLDNVIYKKDYNLRLIKNKYNN
tara:strand:- start:197 stop:457 length:261 start_codon:yes stop_codon:yes gene_type:complete